MRGMAGSDVYFVASAGDVIDESAGGSGGTDTVQSAITFNLGDLTHARGAVENLTLLGSVNLKGSGNSLNNVIVGNSGANSLYAGAGNDSVSGGDGNDKVNGATGNDTLTGGSGMDTFSFTTALNATSNVDRITDFNVSADTIQLENGVIPGLGVAVGTLSAASFWKSASGLAHDATDRVIYETDTGLLNYDSNGSAAGGVFHIARLAPNLALTHADFVVS
jgi:Ca2+-binding RTX toxin-like protein